MFGYIKPFKPQLLICEFDTYQAVYCGLCKQLSSSYGPFARLTLSYDFTFLALLDMALSEEEHPSFKRQNCLYNPLKKKFCCQSCGALQNSASAAMLMMYYKVLDNISDERLIQKIAYRLVLPVAARARKKACAAGFSQADSFIADQMKKQAELEHNNCDSADQASEPTAKSLSYLFALLSEDSEQKRVLTRLGYLLGRWVYLIDALDDIKEDKANNRYNPFLLRAQAGDSLKTLRENAILSCNLTIGEISKTFDLLKIYRYEGILENIINLGLKSSVEQTTEKFSKQQGN